MRLWDVSSGEAVATLRGHTDVVMGVAFAMDGSTLASSSQDTTVKLWELASGEEVATLTGHGAAVRSLAFSPDGVTLATGGWDRTVKLWDVALREEMSTLEGAGGASVAFAADGATLATGTDSGAVKLWNVDSGEELATLQGHTYTLSSVAFSPNGETLSTGGSDDKVKIWDIASRQEVAVLTGHTDAIVAVAFSPVAETLATGSASPSIHGDHAVKLWEAATGQETTTLAAHFGPVRHVTFSPDGATLAVSSSNFLVKLWDTASREEIVTLPGPAWPTDSLAFSPVGATLASASGDGTAKIWTVPEGRQIANLEGHSAEVVSVAFSPDGATLASGSTDSTVKLGNAASGLETATLVGHSAAVRSVAFGPSGATLVSGSTDHTVKLWDTESRAEIRTLLQEDPFEVASVAYSPDGSVVAAGVGGWRATTVTLWRAATGRELATLRGHAGAVGSIAFSRDGSTLASGSVDGTVLLWDMLPYALPPPAFAQRSAWVFDPAGNRDGDANPGERLELRARVKNEGDGDADSVRVTLTIADDDVTVVNGEVAHESWSAGEARNNVGFVLDIAPSATAHEVTAVVDAIAHNGGPWRFTYTFPIVRPAYEFTKRNAWLFDPTPLGSKDGVADAGERLHPRVRLRNDGPGDAANVRVTATTSDPDVTVVNGDIVHAIWPEGAARNNDGLALDIAPDATSHDVTLAVEVTSDGGGLWQFEFVFPIVAPPLEFTKRSAWVFDPSPGGNKDGVANPSERILPRIRLRNDGPGDATNVTVTLSTTDADVAVVSGQVTHDTWAEGAALNSNGLALDIASDAASHEASVTVDVTADSGGPWHFTFTFPILAPAVTYTKRNAWLYEPKASTRNGQADAGERVHPRVRLRNDGPEDAENVTVTLNTDDPDVTVVNGTATHATWPVGAARNNDGLVLDISPDATSHDATVTVDVTADSGGPWRFTFTFPVVAGAPTFVKRNAWIYDPTPRADKDGVAEPGERIRPRIRLKNDGPADAANVGVTLTITDADITVVRAEETHATWPAGAAKTIVGLVLDIAKDATAHEATAVVDITVDGVDAQQFSFTFPIVPGPPEFALRNSWVYDPGPGGNKDGVADPGESVLPRVRLLNTGQTEAENVVVTLSTENADAAVTGATASHATWPAGVARNNNGLAVDIDAGASGPITFIVDVTAENSGPWQFTFDIDVEAAAAPAAVTAFRPATTALLPNYPNPFNPDTWIPFDLSAAADVAVRVYDMKGREVRRVALGYLDAGTYRGRSDAAYWDGRNEFGESVASGVYVCELRAGEFVERRRMVIRK